MKIAVEATNAQGAATGFGQYVINLLRAMAEFNTGHEFLLLHAGKEWHGPDFGSEFKPVSYHFGKQSLGIVFWLNHVLKREGADIFHATCTTGVPPIKVIPTVTTIHDLYPVIHPEHCSAASSLFFKHLIKWTVRNSDHFLCNSEFTASELRRYVDLPHDNVTVTRLAPAVGGLAGDLPSPEERSGFLCVGAIEPRKNQLLMLDAYNEAVKKNPGVPELTIIGPDRGDGAALKQKIISYDLGHKVEWLNYVPVEALSEYYRNAKIFVFPSVYEGFGLPLLEAMRYRLPIVCGDIPVLHEVGGNYPLYVAPKKLSAWVDAFLNYKELNFSCDPEKRLSEFSWRRCAEQTLKVYESVLRK